MLIFYVQKTNAIGTITQPIVIIDAMSSDDRFSTTDINKIANSNAPDNAYLVPLVVFSCEYTAQFEHIGMPLGQSIKTRFSGTLKSPPAELVSAFSPVFLTSSQNVQEMADTLSTIPNIQTRITYAAMVVLGASGNPIVRQFILYAAPLYPDTYGTTTTMVLFGSMIDNIIIKSTVACQIDKKTPLFTQLDILLSSQSPSMVGNYTNAPQALSIPATERLFPPMKLYDLLSEICLQNKMIFAIDGLKVTFYGIGQQNAPKILNYTPPKFSFLGSAGYLAWGLGVENYANIKFKSAIFDCKLFGKITLYNDIKSAFFEGLVKNPASSLISKTVLSTVITDAYDAWIIRYLIKWSRTESICEVTASNNWIMSQFRVDGLLESAIYSSAAVSL